MVPVGDVAFPSRYVARLIIAYPHMLAPAQIATVTTPRLIMAVAESPD